MALTDENRDQDNGPDTTPGIPPSRPAPLSPQPVAAASPVADTAFRPPERDSMSGLSIGLAVAVVVLGLYVLVNWPWSRSKPPEPAAAPVAAVAPADTAPAAPAEPASGTAPPAVPPAQAPTDATGLVHRCEKPGEVTYTDGPCPSGTRGSPVSTATALSVEGARGTTLYRCKGAGRFWSVVHCQHRGAEVVGTHTVPADLPLAEQILFAQNREALMSRPARQATAASGPPAPPSAASLKAAECRRLDEGVAVLDAYARQPLSGGEQDRVARQRRDLRDEQFRLRCGR